MLVVVGPENDSVSFDESRDVGVRRCVCTTQPSYHDMIGKDFLRRVCCLWALDHDGRSLGSSRETVEAVEGTHSPDAEKHPCLAAICQFTVGQGQDGFFVIPIESPFIQENASVLIEVCPCRRGATSGGVRRRRRRCAVGDRHDWTAVVVGRSSSEFHERVPFSDWATRLAASPCVVRWRNAYNEMRSPPRSPVAKSHHRPVLRFTLNDPRVRSGRRGLREHHSSPIRSPSGSQRASRKAEFPRAEAAMARKSCGNLIRLTLTVYPAQCVKVLGDLRWAVCGSPCRDIRRLDAVANAVSPR